MRDLIIISELGFELIVTIKNMQYILWLKVIKNSLNLNFKLIATLFIKLSVIKVNMMI
jgi:hypothetical protein